MTINYFIAFTVTMLAMGFLSSVAPRVGLVDHPGGRKQHGHPTPLVGGIAMFCGFLFSTLTLQPLPSYLVWFIATSALLVVVGILDDRYQLSPKTKLIAQILATLIMTLWADIAIDDLGELSGHGLISLDSFAIPFTVFATVGVINALNMIDGIDGLAGGLSLIALGLLGYLAIAGGRVEEGYLLLLTVSAIGAFLSFNLRFPWRKQAAVFMGDAGSMFLGFTLAWFFVSLSQGEQRVIMPVTALWLFALPLFDTISLMVRRILKGRSPFSADREHFHHVLQLAGFSVNQSVLIMYGLALVLAFVGLAGLYAGIPEWVMFYGFMALFSLYFWAIMHAWKVMKFVRASRSAHRLLPHSDEEREGYLGVRTED